MNDDQDKTPPDGQDGLEREIRQGRKFTPQEAMARMAGPGSMKGASPVPPLEQAEIEIGTWLRGHLDDAAGALQTIVHRQLKGSGLLLDHLDQPLVALTAFCRQVLASDYLLDELVREVDVEWGRMMDERPRFEREGSPPHPDDAYTVEAVRNALDKALRELGAHQAN